ncbi:NinE family protein [Cedecea sp.]|uniref:NinE family protein n=1 Tax=Cedecea sp. TaxID=1970739 RepID=UPI002F3E805F
MKRTRSPTQKALDNLIFNVRHRSKRKPEPLPSEIKTYDHSCRLSGIRKIRMRARK